MKRHILIAPLVSLGLVVAACGGGDDVAVDPPPAQPAETPARADGAELRAPTPIEAAAPGRAVGNGSAAAPAAAESDIATNEMTIAPFVAEFVLADDFPSLPSDDVGYVFDGSTAVSSDQVVGLAAAFGLEGEPTQIDDGSWILGPDDGSAPNIWVNADAQQGWNYSSAWADSAVDEPCAVSVDANGNELVDCPEPEPPVGVPNADEAEQRARESLAALGIDVDSLTFETFADEWSANVNADDRDGERPATRFWNFGYGTEGVLQYAGGSLATPQPVGPYPLVDLETAVDRLRDQGGFGVPLPLLDGPASAAEGDAATSGLAPVEGRNVPVETIVPDETLPFDPSFDPPLDGEAVIVTLVDVHADLWWVWDADDTVWLVPAYRFVDTDGSWHTVPAVTEEFLIPAVGDGPIPVEPDGGIGDGAEPLPTEPSSAPDDEPIDVEPDVDPEVALGVLEEYVGLSIEEFTADAKALGYETRIVEQDGQALAVTADYSETRVNVVAEGLRVTALESIG